MSNRKFIGESVKMLTIMLGEYFNWQRNIDGEEKDKILDIYDEDEIMGIEVEYLSWQFSL